MYKFDYICLIYLIDVKYNWCELDQFWKIVAAKLKLAKIWNFHQILIKGQPIHHANLNGTGQLFNPLKNVKTGKNLKRHFTYESPNKNLKIYFLMIT